MAIVVIINAIITYFIEYNNFHIHNVYAYIHIYIYIYIYIHTYIHTYINTFCFAERLRRRCVMRGAQHKGGGSGSTARIDSDYLEN